MNLARVALAGYGVGGRFFHAPLIASTPGLELVSVVTNNDGRRAQVAADWPSGAADAGGGVGAGAVAVVDSVEDAFARGCELLVISTANETHVPLARAAIARGVAVVVDKPLAVTAAEAAALVSEADAADVLLTVFHNRRWDSEILTLRALIESGRLGEVLRFESRFERWRPQVDPGLWRSEGADRGGGILLDLGSHVVDQALVLFGPVVSAYAELANIRGVPAEDDAFVALQHAGGVVSHLHVSLVTAAPGPRLRVLGTAGAYIVDGVDSQEGELRAGKRPEAGVEWGAEPRERWGRFVAGDSVETVPSEHGDWPWFYTRLAEALHAGGSPPVDPRDAVAVLRVLEAARESAVSGQVVSLAA
jgi:scyllo-inositol 2-dehydrogenase (NADP+)